MAGWHHWLDGRESEWTPGVVDAQGGLACCKSWGCKESDMTERLNWTELKWVTTVTERTTWDCPFSYFLIDHSLSIDWFLSVYTFYCNSWQRILDLTSFSSLNLISLLYYSNEIFHQNHKWTPSCLVWKSVLKVLEWDTTFQQHLTHPGFTCSETQLFLVSFLSPLATLPSSPLQTLPHWTVPGVSLWNFSVLFSVLPWWFHSVSWKLQI